MRVFVCIFVGCECVELGCVPDVTRWLFGMMLSASALVLLFLFSFGACVVDVACDSSAQSHSSRDVLLLHTLLPWFHFTERPSPTVAP